MFFPYIKQKMDKTTTAEEMLRHNTVEYNQLNKHVYRFLNEGPPHPRIPQFYGIPKIHKKYINLPPMRPIILQSSSLLSPSTQFIDHVLQPLAMSYPDYIQNSTALTLLLQDTTVPDDAILVTVDVANLYPSIPQSECLSIIHTEMHNKSHLFTFDPNFITRLLHININHNYFRFGHHTFQQIKGTAMGAAFSPTITNIFMSSIIRSFLLTQHIQPHTVTFSSFGQTLQKHLRPSCMILITSTPASPSHMSTPQPVHVSVCVCV